MRNRNGLRPHAAVVGGLALVLAIAIGTMLITGHDHSAERIEPTQVAPGVDALVPQLPIGADEPFVVSMSDGIFVFGTDLAAGAGANRVAVFNTTSGALTEVTAPPFSAPLSGGDGVWTGERLVVVGVLCSSKPVIDDSDGYRQCSPGSLAAASYDPQSNAWEEIPAPDSKSHIEGNAGGFGDAVGWTGSGAVFRLGAPDSSLVAYQPASKSWVTLPPVDADLDQSTTCLAGTSIVVGIYRGNSTDQGLTPVEAPMNLFRYRDGGAAWEELPSPDLLELRNQPEGPMLACGEDRLLLTTGRVEPAASYTFDTGEWTLTSAPGGNASVALSNGTEIPVAYPFVAWTGDRFVLWGAARDYASLAFTPTRNGWSYAPAGPRALSQSSRSLSWLSSRGYFLSGSSAGIALLRWDTTQDVDVPPHELPPGTTAPRPPTRP